MLKKMMYGSDWMSSFDLFLVYAKRIRLIIKFHVFDDEMSHIILL